MKKTINRIVCIFIVGALALLGNNTLAQKLKAEDVVAKHLESLGTAADRTAAKNYLLIGASNFKELRRANAVLEGRAVFASESNKMLFGFAFNAPSYAQERIIYNGSKS